MVDDYRDDIARGVAKQKARFYADPRFAALVAGALGFIAGALIF